MGNKCVCRCGGPCRYVNRAGMRCGDCSGRSFGKRGCHAAKDDPTGPCLKPLTPKKGSGQKRARACSPSDSDSTTDAGYDEAAVAQMIGEMFLARWRRSSCYPISRRNYHLLLKADIDALRDKPRYADARTDTRALPGTQEIMC
eukprot:gene4229-15221_t